ncbi:MAG: LuxR C-terminal-related transcriptional regulator [Cyanobacteria bacterium J06639_1]
MPSITRTSIQSLFQAISVAENETELQQTVMPKVGQYFEANRWGLMMADRLPANTSTMPKAMQLALSLDYNPVLRYLVERHAAVHDEVILSPGVWRTICPRADHGHVMVGPVVGQHRLVGGVALTRHRNDAAFNSENLADLNAICLHISTCWNEMNASASDLDFNSARDRLTERELEIAELVAKGLTNKDIGAALWITENSVKQALKRMYRKLEVASRAEMVAKLAMKKTGARQ